MSGVYAKETTPQARGFTSFNEMIGAGLCEKCLERSTRALIESKLGEERECAVCHEIRRDVGGDGVCERCVITRERRERRAAVIRQIADEGLRGASFDKLRDVSNMAIVKNQLGSAMKNKKSVYQYGLPGAGKSTTHAACFLKMAALGESVHWTSQAELLRVIADEPSMIQNYVQRACGGVLFIEDMGAPVEKSWSLAHLAELIDLLHCHRSRARVWVTSNYSLEQLRARFYEQWKEFNHMGADATTRRLFEMCVRIHNKSENMTKGAG